MHLSGPPAIEPHNVYGGFMIAETTWTRTEDGWECDYDLVTSTLYPTREACQEAIDRMVRPLAIAA